MEQERKRGKGKQRNEGRIGKKRGEKMEGEETSSKDKPALYTPNLKS